jgi:hypothetical protein
VAWLLVTVFAISIAGVAFAAPPSGSGNPRFTKGPTNEGVKSDGSDTVSGSIQGVGQLEVTFVAEADAAALYACKNNGGNFPSDPKKQAEADAVRTETNVTPQNGKASFSTALQVPASTLNCPGGQTAMIVCVEYANKRVTVTQGTTVVIPTTSTTPSSVSAIFENRFRDECTAFFASNP